MKDEERKTSNDFSPGFYFLLCDVPDCVPGTAHILHCGWGLPKGWASGVLHLFRTLPKPGNHLGALSPPVPSARCIFMALQCHSTSSGLLAMGTSLGCWD